MQKTIKFFTELYTCDCGVEVPLDTSCHNCEKAYPGDDLPKERYSDGEFSFSFPAQNIVCPCCNGTGSTYLGWHNSEQPSFTSEDFGREGPDFYEDYMSGRYDRKCPECKGRNVVAEIVPDYIPKKHMGVWEAYCKDMEALAYHYAEQAAERRMGA